MNEVSIEKSDSAESDISNQEILLDLADFAGLYFLGHGIMGHIPWPLSQSNLTAVNFLISTLL